MRILLLSVLLAFAFSPGAMATDQSVAERVSHFDEAIQTFTLTCMAHFFNKEDLHAKYDHHPDKAVTYTQQQAQAFLRGAKGSAWGIRGKASNYVVLLTESGICSVSAQKAGPAVSRDFDEFLKIFFDNTALVPVSPEIAGPNNDLVKSKGYRLSVKGKVLPPVFSIVESRDPNLNFAALVSIYFPLETSQAKKSAAK